MSGRVLTQ